MIYLALAILCSTTINWIFKSFKKAEVNIFNAIIINYFTCSVIGQLYGNCFVFSAGQIDKNYFWFSLILGILFVGVFFCMAKTTEHFGISANAVSAKMAFIFPALFYFFWLNENMSWIKWLGMGLALAALILINFGGKNDTSKSIKYYFPILVFLGCGIIDTCMKWIDLNFLNGNSPIMATTTIFTGAFVIGLTILIFRGQTKSITIRDWIAGIALGIPNFFSIYFLLLAIQKLSGLNTGDIFAVNNVGVILISTLGAWIIFKEKLSKYQKTGLIISMITIALLSNAI